MRQVGVTLIHKWLCTVSVCYITAQDVLHNEATTQQAQTGLSASDNHYLHNLGDFINSREVDLNFKKQN